MRTNTPTHPQPKTVRAGLVDLAELPADPKIISRIRRLCDENKWDLREFIRRCAALSICEASTAREIYAGSAKIRLTTAAALASRVFGRSLDALFDVQPD